MKFLELLEHLRHPIFTEINMVFTVMGEGLFFLCILCLLFWCVDKKLAYRICFIYILAGLAVQTLKITFRIKRPFIRNTSLNPVEDAKRTATGYSFPSGHTQNVTSLFITFSHLCKKNIYKILCFVPIILVMFSRMYLGVHTPYDVLVSFGISAIITIIVNYIFDNYSLHSSHKKWIFIIFSMIILGITAYSVYINIYVDDIIKENMVDIFKCCGASLGFLIGWFIEISKINFNEKAASIPFQIIKYILGVVLLISIRIIIKYVLELIGFNSLANGFVEYMVLTLFITVIYPILIKIFFTDSELAYRH